MLRHLLIFALAFIPLCAAIPVALAFIPICAAIPLALGFIPLRHLLAVALAVIPLGCVDRGDVTSSDSSDTSSDGDGDTTDGGELLDSMPEPSCEIGSLGCECTPGGNYDLCDDPLVACEAGVCVACEAGTFGCACYESGVCEPGLACSGEQICRVA